MAKTEKKVRGVYEKVPGSGVWWVRHIDAEGRLRREKIGSKSAAIKLAETRRTAARERVKLLKFRAPRVIIRFGELCDAYSLYAEKHNLGWRADKNRIVILKAAFGDREAEIPIADLRDWFDGQAWAPATYNRWKTVLRSVYNFAIENKRTTNNPARLLKARRPPKGRVRMLEADEEARLRKVILEKHAQHLPEFEICLGTGLRRKEQYVLINWSCVDLLRSDLFVPESKNGEPRHIPLSPSVRSAFQTLYAKTKGEDPIFKSARGGAPLKGPKHWFEDAVTAAGIENFTWHCLRHTFASRCVMGGVDLSTVAELLGHKSTLMTTRYAHLSQPHKVAAIAKLTAFNAKESEAAAILIFGRQNPTDTTTDTGEKSVQVMVADSVQ